MYYHYYYRVDRLTAVETEFFYTRCKMACKK